MSKPLHIHVLTRAREVIAKRGSWCKKMLGCSFSGRSVTPWDPIVLQRCALGAIHFAMYEMDKKHAYQASCDASPLFRQVVASLADVIDPKWRLDSEISQRNGVPEEVITKSVVAHFNDHGDTSHAMVLAKFDEALR